MRSFLPNQGFTLIEIMMAVVVGGILFSGGLAAYRGFGERQVVKQAGNTFRINLRSFQRKALSGEKASGCTGSFRGYRVSYVTKSSYTVQADCSLNDPASQVIDLERGAYFPTDWGDIFFPVLRVQVTGSGNVEITNGNYSYIVTIEPIGVIKGEFREVESTGGVIKGEFRK